MDSTPAAQHGTLRVRFTAIGFMVGSFLFALGVPLSLDSDLDPSVAGWTFFAGSVFFTTAGLLQFLSSREHAQPASGESSGGSWIGRKFHARSLDWTASAIQLAGTLFFNVNTFRAATILDPTTAEVNRLVWAPDALGSILFLVSSGIAFAPEVRWRRHRHARNRSWAIGALNLLGSVFFGLSAIGALLLPDTGSAVNVVWANAGTFLGAVCFFVGAALLLPRRSHSSS